MLVQGFVLDLFYQRPAPFYRGFVPLFQQHVAPFYRTLTTTTDQQTSVSLGVIDLFSVCVETHLTDCGIIVIDVLEEPLLGEPLLGHGLLIELDVRLCEKAVLGLITSVGEGFVSRPHFLGVVHRGSYLLTSGKLKGRRNCLRIMRNERKKVKMMQRSRKSERTLTSCMDGMRQTLEHLEPCNACKE